ncbi:hypothetical protein I3300191I4_10840 [Megasphaera elsdenii]
MELFTQMPALKDIHHHFLILFPKPMGHQFIAAGIRLRTEIPIKLEKFLPQYSQRLLHRFIMTNHHKQPLPNSFG